MTEDIVATLRRWAKNANEQGVQEAVDGLTAAADEIERLRKERDEAMRRVCDDAIRNGRVYRRAGSYNVRCQTPQEVAEMMGWDCFKEEQ